MASAGGKRLPPVAETPPSWNVRDTAEQILATRQDYLQAPAAAAPFCSSSFDTEGLVYRLPERAHLVRRAFDAAARTVLKALEKPDSKQQAVQGIPLPQALQDVKRLQVLRTQSLERARDNKEYAKRKGKVDVASPSVTFSSTATTTPHAAVSSANAAATNTTSPNKTLSTGGSNSSPTGAATEKPTSSSSKKASSSSSSSDTNVAPKFTRNTPASSAAALDFRFQSSRAILCAAGNMAFGHLTVGPDEPVRQVPQNPDYSSVNDDNTNNHTESSPAASSTVNMGSVVVEAKILAHRTISVVENAVRRSDLRYQYRKDNARFDTNTRDANRNDDAQQEHFLKIENPYAWKDPEEAQDSMDDEGDDDNEEDDDDLAIPHNPNYDSITPAWQNACLPRMLSILQKGAGHAIYHDVDWDRRHGRVASLVRALCESQDNWGPHLILTTEPQLVPFVQEFHDMSVNLRLILSPDSKKLQALAYPKGNKAHRRKLRKYFSQANGLPEAPFHVLIASYGAFLEDYIHFCQLPFQAVILDDGVAWMAAAQSDSNSAIGSIWEHGLFSSNDKHVGLAATTFKEWDYTVDQISETAMKNAWVGLTARHRIVTTSTFSVPNRMSVELAPVSGLVNFVSPHFGHVVREEWDRSRIASDAASMKHFRKLVARSVVVHKAHDDDNDDDDDDEDMLELALQAMTGKLPSADRSSDPQVPTVLSDEDLVSSGKIAFSRRHSLSWFGPPATSWMRYELGKAKLQNILDAMKASNNHGHFCEEITTASSTTSSGATGQVAGTMAYRPAIRCCRHFGSEPGLRQHVSALHAPPGTWLCRTCGSDCITSQARTHHERSCGQPTNGAGSEQAGAVGATPTVGQGANAKSGVGKKKGNRTGASQQAGAAVEEKDPDGSFRVPGYRGVWVNKAGKHFVKIDGKNLTDEQGDGVLLFDNIDDAARKHDEVSKAQKKKNQKLELNFKPDGSRVMYEDITPASTSGLGGSAANVVPALSVINIKDLPPDVKPLLRDPRQTSRTGGNSKRHVYAYRGVCRQARKGHDRWQSQISFMGVNHYLGTFDSEWDAAAIYAWAHLILYGDEATKQAQKEGEEAAAAYEQERRDIAAGKIPEPPLKPEKKKKKPKNEKDDSGDNKDEGEKPAPKKRKAPSKDASAEKKQAVSPKTPKGDKEAIAPTLAKGVAKAPILASREIFDSIDDSDLLTLAAQRLTAASEAHFEAWSYSWTPTEPLVRPCIPCPPHSLLATTPVGTAMLFGLSPSLVQWDLARFVESQQPFLSEQESMTAIQMLAVEYDEDSVNEKFRTVMQGPVCVIGCASPLLLGQLDSLGLTVAATTLLGGTLGRVDCHIGGIPGSCREEAAVIRHRPTTTHLGDYQFACLSNEDMVTLNGARITSESGWYPLRSEDILSVGARVFCFLMPSDKYV